MPRGGFVASGRFVASGGLVASGRFVASHVKPKVKVKVKPILLLEPLKDKYVHDTSKPITTAALIVPWTPRFLG